MNERRECEGRVRGPYLPSLQEQTFLRRFLKDADPIQLVGEHNTDMLMAVLTDGLELEAIEDYPDYEPDDADDQIDVGKTGVIVNKHRGRIEYIGPSDQAGSTLLGNPDFTLLDLYVYTKIDAEDEESLISCQIAIMGPIDLETGHPFSLGALVSEDAVASITYALAECNEFHLNCYDD